MDPQSHKCGTFVGIRPYNTSGSVHLAIGEILNESDSGPVGLEGPEPWKQVVESSYPACWYRFSVDGQVEVLALGARVVVPMESLPLLPEPIARAVLAELAERVASDLRAAAKSAPAEEEP